VRAWLESTDRIPPAELLERILSDTAYGFEIDGPRRRQAWENLKKMRGLVRRIQNRGYATVRRIAEHLTALTAGDQSNAAIEAVDAVNLMTVHASKGLEFPIVFVVNLAKGASAPPKPVRVVVAGSDADGNEQLSVTVGPFQSDTDEAERERERHETRRLLYVALTRARDRLYLGTTLKDGVLAAGRGSLGEVLPDSLKALFTHAATVFSEVEAVGWTGTSGHQYLWRLCRTVESGKTNSNAGSALAATGSETAPDDFGALASAGPSRLTATDLAGPIALDDFRQTGRSERLLGILIHRLFETGDRLRPLPHTSVLEAAARMLSPQDRALLDDPDAVLAAAIAAWARGWQRDDVVEALSGLSRVYEVPFSMIDGEGEGRSIVRGTIDCLVCKSERHYAVVELKTGGRAHAHQRQLEIYVRAARRLLAGAQVEGILLYL
jgi:ATP-dependent helicase/nuclease subunit A